MAKLRCPNCNSLVPIPPGSEHAVCTVCAFSGPPPGVKAGPAVAFPGAWKPGQANPTQAQKRWTLVREPGDAPAKTPMAAPPLAAVKPASRGPAPPRPVAVSTGGGSGPQRKVPAAKPTTEPKHNGMPWWLYVLLSILTLGIFALAMALRRKK